MLQLLLIIQDQPAPAFDIGDANGAWILNFLVITQSQDQRNFFPAPQHELFAQAVPEGQVAAQAGLQRTWVIGVLQFEPGQAIAALGWIHEERGQQAKQVGNGRAMGDKVGPGHFAEPDMALPIGVKAAGGELDNQLPRFAPGEGGLGQVKMLSRFTQRPCPIQALPDLGLQGLALMMAGHEWCHPLRIATDRQQGLGIGRLKEGLSHPLKVFKALRRVRAKAAIGCRGEQALKRVGDRTAAKTEGEQGGGEADRRE